MPLHPQSPEFTRLATRWLDGSATALEAAQLWESVGADAACAREFAQQSRFELLLQDTLRERRREQQIAAGASREAVRHHGRTVRRRVLMAAAGILAVGFLVWLVFPNHSTRPDIAHAPVAAPLKAATPRHGIKPWRTMVLVARQKSPAAVSTKPGSLQKRLDDFFLTSVSLDKVPLKQALKQLEDQLHELNFASSADLAVLRVQLPAGAGPQPVTFHSGSISFLKALRALAVLAGYEVDVTDANVALVARPGDGPYRQQSYGIADLLAGMGGIDDPTRNPLAELLNDATALGLQVNFATNGSATGLLATPGELQALGLLAQSRDQVRSLPPLRFYVRAAPATADAQDRILTGPEADQARADFLLSSSPDTPPAIITLPLQESAPDGTTAQPGEIFAFAAPVGTDRISLNLTPGTVDLTPPVQQNLSPGLAGSQDPLLAIVNRPDVIQFNALVPSSSKTISIITPPSAIPPGANLTTANLAANTGQTFTINSAIAVGAASSNALSESGTAVVIRIIPVPPASP